MSVEDIFPYLDFTNSTCSLRHGKVTTDDENEVGSSTQLTSSREMTMDTVMNAHVNVQNDASGEGMSKFIVVQNQIGCDTKFLDFARLDIRARTLKKDIENLKKDSVVSHHDIEYGVLILQHIRNVYFILSSFPANIELSIDLRS